MEPVEQISSNIISEEGPHQAEVEEFINIVAEGVPQEPPFTVEPMEEDEPRWEGPEAERTMGPTEEEAMGIMDVIYVIM